MRLKRFKQIKRFWHINDPYTELAPDKQYKKISLASKHLQVVLQDLLTPYLTLSFDKMIVAFRGRTRHKKKALNKPILEGY